MILRQVWGCKHRLFYVIFWQSCGYLFTMDIGDNNILKKCKLHLIQKYVHDYEMELEKDF